MGDIPQSYPEPTQQATLSPAIAALVNDDGGSSLGQSSDGGVGHTVQELTHNDNTGAAFSAN